MRTKDYDFIIDRKLGASSNMKKKPDDYSRHEALHMANYLAEQVHEQLCIHPSVSRNKDWLKLAFKANDALAKLYQKIGDEHLVEKPIPPMVWRNLPSNEAEYIAKHKEDEHIPHEPMDAYKSGVSDTFKHLTDPHEVVRTSIAKGKEQIDGLMRAMGGMGRPHLTPLNAAAKKAEKRIADSKSDLEKMCENSPHARTFRDLFRCRNSMPKRATAEIIKMLLKDDPRLFHVQEMGVWCRENAELLASMAKEGK